MNERRNPAGSDSYTIQRMITGIVALLLTAFALMVTLNQLRTGFDLMGAIFGSCAATIATICWWFALRGHIAESRVRMRFALKGGLVLGGISFAAGFLGPAILTPRANQGPLLGIFITGPLGFILGTAIGWIYARFRTHEPRSG